MSKRPPNELESKLHQAALASPNKELSNKQAEGIIPDITKRQNALNFLLGVGLFKSLVDGKGSVSFRAVTKNELAASKDLSGEESLVLGHIKASRNEGIWTKHLKAKTNLHQTVIERCLKTLTQKHLIKRVPSVQHPTRKIYMLESLEPSVALTGGPWYTDNELDTEFIQHLRDVCLKFIRDITFPKRRKDDPEGALYALSSSPEYPNAEEIRGFLRRARLTETDLSVEHVEMLLNVLVLDGEIEKMPPFGPSMRNSLMNYDDTGDESEQISKKKRKRKKDDSHKRKRKKKLSEKHDDSSDDSLKKRVKKKLVKAYPDSDNDSPDNQPRKKKSRGNTSDSDESGSSDDEDKLSRKRREKRRKSKMTKELSDSENSASDGQRKKTANRSMSPFPTWNDDTSGISGYVYRAIRQESLMFGSSEAPCSQCPSFDFCKVGGPVNPKECVYYGSWLVGGTVAAMDVTM